MYISNISFLEYLFSNFNQFYEIENIQNVLNYHIKDKIYKKFKVLDLKELFTITPNLYLFDILVCLFYSQIKIFAVF